MDVGRSWGSAIVAASRVAGHLLSGPALRRYRTTWGATEDEVAAAWPGDEFLPDPDWTSTHAITISASPDEVWPWVAQIGQGREDSTASRNWRTSSVARSGTLIRSSPNTRIHWLPGKSGWHHRWPCRWCWSTRARIWF